MPLVLVGTDLVRDPAIEDRYSRSLRESGFIVEVARPMMHVAASIETIARTGGKIDAVVLAHHGSMSSSLTNPVDAVRAIRRLDDDLSFRGAVRSKTVPIVAVAEWLSLPDAFDADWFDVVLPSRFDQHPEALVAALFGVVEEWRQSLLAELDYVGYAVTIGPEGQLDVSHALVRRRREGHILTSEATPGSLRAGQYLILAQDVLQEFEPYLKLRYLLNNYKAIASAETTKPETVFQRFFEEHPHLIRRELFDHHWSQPSLRVPGNTNEVLRPDFVLKPRVGAEIGTKWQVLDLKLPDDRLVVSKGFHAALSAKLTRAVQQLQDYRDYFNRPDAGAELVRHFGFRPKNPKLAVLIGKRRDIDDSELLDKAQARYLDVEILTYDEIIDAEAHRLALHSALARVF